MLTKSRHGRTVATGSATTAWLFSGLLLWTALPSIVAAQTAAEGADTSADASADASADTGQALPPADAQAPVATPPAQTPAPAPARSESTAFVPAEPLGATAQREQVDSEPPDGFDLSRFPDRVDRSGFTMEIGIGLALTHISFDVPEGLDFVVESETEFGLAPPSLSLGGFITPDLALMFRMAGTSWFTDLVPGESIMFHSTFFGGAIQFWPSNDLFLGAGIGLGLLDNYIFSEDVESDTGLMLTGRVGWSFYHYDQHSLALVGEVFPAFYDGATAVGFAANFEWQLL